MDKIANVLSRLALVGAVAGCEPEPLVQPSIELVSPELNRELTCLRERFQAVGIPNPLESYTWARKYCPEFDAEVKKSMEMGNPFKSILELRKDVLRRAGIASDIVSWIVPKDTDKTKVEETATPNRVQRARKEKRIR